MGGGGGERGEGGGEGRRGGSYRPPRLCRTLSGPLPVLLLTALFCCGGYGGRETGGCCALPAIPAAAAARVPLRRQTTPEASLRDAVTRNRATVLTLTSDVSLTADIPAVKCTDLVIIGACKTSSGRPRRCKIDGGEKFQGFFIYWKLRRSRLELRNLELTRMVGTAMQASSPTHVMSNCVVSHSSSTGGLIFVVGEFLIEKTTFTGNKGEVISIIHGSMNVRDSVFRGNENNGTSIITAYRAEINFTRCGFENNKAREGAAVMEVGWAWGNFSRSWFVGNMLTKEGARGGAVHLSGGSVSGATFCRCRFEGNTVTLPGGRKRTEHVVVGPEATATFCPRRPSNGLVLPPRNESLNFEESCNDCPS